jgi:pseudaminic acid cytidylyltransferase
VIAIIPARGGSKRVPGKNIMDFLGKPMIAWTIEAAKASGLFDKIVVSTDDEAIAAVSKVVRC